MVARALPVDEERGEPCTSHNPWLQTLFLLIPATLAVGDRASRSLSLELLPTLTCEEFRFCSLQLTTQFSSSGTGSLKHRYGLRSFRNLALAGISFHWCSQLLLCGPTDDLHIKKMLRCFVSTPISAPVLGMQNLVGHHLLAHYTL